MGCAASAPVEFIVSINVYSLVPTQTNQVMAGFGTSFYGWQLSLSILLTLPLSLLEKLEASTIQELS